MCRSSVFIATLDMAESDRGLTVLGGEKQVETEAESGGPLQVCRREWLCTQDIFSFLEASWSQDECKEVIYYSSHGDLRPLCSNSLWLGLLVSVL